MCGPGFGRDVGWAHVSSRRTAHDDVPPGGLHEHDFRGAAKAARATVAEEFDDWGTKVHQRVRSGSPANEVAKAARQLETGLIVIAAGGRGLSDTVLLESTAQRIQQYAPCPVLTVRPTPRKLHRTR